MSGSDSDVEVKITANTSEAEQKVREFGSQITETLGGGLGGLIEKFKAFRDQVVAAFAVYEIEEFMSKFAEMGESIEHATQMLGMSAEAISDLNAAFAVMGLSADRSTFMLERLERNISQAARGSGPAADAFAVLGLSFEQLSKMSPEQVLEQLAETFSHAPDGPAKTAVAIALMGRAGAEMIPVLNKGAAGLKEFEQIAEETGTHWSAAQVQAAAQTAEGMHTLGLAFTGLGKTIFEEVEPQFDALVNWLTQVVEGIRRNIEQGGILKDTIDFLGTAFTAIIDVIRVFISGLKMIYDGFLLLIDAVVIATDTVKSFWKIFTGGDSAAAVEAVKQRLDEMRKHFQDFKTDAADFFGGKNKVGAGAAQGPYSGSPSDEDYSSKGLNNKPIQDPSALAEERKMRQQAIEGYIALYKLDVEAKREAIQEKVALGQMDVATETQQLTQLENASFEAQHKALEQEANIQGLSQSQRQGYQIKIQELERQHQLNLQKIESEGARAAVEIQRMEVNERLKLENILLEGKKAEIQDQIAQGDLANNAQYGQLAALEERTYQNQRQMLENQMDGLAAGSKQAIQYYNQMEELDLQHQVKMTQIDRQYNQARLNDEKAVVSQMGSEFETMARGVLSGQMTISQGFQRMLGDMIMQWAKALMEMLIDYALFHNTAAVQEKDFGLMGVLFNRLFNAQKVGDDLATETKKTAIETQGEATRKGIKATGAATDQQFGILGALWHSLFETEKTAATATGEETRVAIKATATEEGHAIESAAAGKSVMSDAAQAFSGAYKAVVGIPYVGPILAPIAGATAFAAVAAYETIASAAGGMTLDKDQLVQAHAKEMILPSHLSQGLQSIISANGMVGPQQGGGAAGVLAGQGGGGAGLHVGGDLNVTMSHPGGAVSESSMITALMGAARRGNPALRRLLSS